jgi:hypothetical protein
MIRCQKPIAASEGLSNETLPERKPEHVAVHAKVLSSSHESRSFWAMPTRPYGLWPESRQLACKFLNENVRDDGRPSEPAFNLMAAASPEAGPFREVLTVVGQQAIAAFAEPGASTSHDVLLVECRHAAAFNVNRPAVYEALQGYLFDGAWPQVPRQTCVVQHHPVAGIDSMVGVTPPRRDEMGADGRLQPISCPHARGGEPPLRAAGLPRPAHGRTVFRDGTTGTLMHSLASGRGGAICAIGSAAAGIAMA